MIGLKRLLALVILVSNIDPLILLVCKILFFNTRSNSLSNYYYVYADSDRSRCWREIGRARRLQISDLPRGLRHSKRSITLHISKNNMDTTNSQSVMYAD